MSRSGAGSVARGAGTLRQERKPEFIGPYQIFHTIGEGMYAKVKLGEDEFKQKVAIKIFDKIKIERTQHALQQVEKEINALRALRHPNIVQFHEVLETDTKVFLVMEYLSHGELYDHIQNRGKLPEAEARRLFRQIVSAVHHCHSRGIIHRDIKPENILLDDKMNVKLVDFGLSTFVPPPGADDDGKLNYGAAGAVVRPATGPAMIPPSVSAPTPTPSFVPPGSVGEISEVLRTQCGSPHYAAPEILTGREYSGPQIDVWSLGVLLYAMLCGTLPFSARAMPVLIKKIVDGKFMLPTFLSAPARDLLTCILRTDPSRRYTLQAMRQHPWLKKISLPRPIGAPGAPIPGDGDESPPDSPSNSPTFHPPSVSRPEIVASDVVYAEPVGVAPSVPSDASSQSALLGTPADAADGTSPPVSPRLAPFPRRTPPIRVSSAGVASLSLEPVAVTPAAAAPRASGLTSALAAAPREVVCRSCGKKLSIRLNARGEVSLAVPKRQGAAEIAAAAAAAAADPFLDLCTCDKAEGISSPTSPSSPRRSGGESEGASAIYYGAASPEQIRKAAPGTSDAVPISSAYSLPTAAESVPGTSVTGSLAQSVLSPKAVPFEEKASQEREELFQLVRRTDVAGLEQRIRDELKLVSLVGPKGLNDPAKWNALLHFACDAGNEAIVSILLASNLPLNVNCVDRYNWSPLMICSWRGHMRLVKLLLKYKAAIHIRSVDGKTAIFLAREAGHNDIAALLTEISSQRRQTKQSAQVQQFNSEFLMAAEAGDTNKVRHLLKLNAAADKRAKVVDVRTRGIDNWTALHFAARKGHLEIAQMLLTEHPPVDINATTKSGWTPLMMACDRGHVEIVKLLLQNGADPNIVSTDRAKYTALKLALESRNSAILDLLTGAGAVADPTAEAGLAP